MRESVCYLIAALSLIRNTASKARKRRFPMFCRGSNRGVIEGQHGRVMIMNNGLFVQSIN